MPDKTLNTVGHCQAPVDASFLGQTPVQSTEKESSLSAFSVCVFGVSEIEVTA